MHQGKANDPDVASTLVHGISTKTSLTVSTTHKQTHFLLGKSGKKKGFYHRLYIKVFTFHPTFGGLFRSIALKTNSVLLLNASFKVCKIQKKSSLWIKLGKEDHCQFYCSVFILAQADFT